MSESTNPAVRTEIHLAMSTVITAALRVADQLGLRVTNVSVSGSDEPLEVHLQFPNKDVAAVDSYADKVGLPIPKWYANYHRTGVATFDGHPVRVTAYCGNPNPPQDAQ